MNIQALKRDLRAYGFAVIPSLIPRAEAKRAAERLVAIMKRQPDAGDADQHLGNALDHLDESDYPLFAKLLAHPVCLELAKELLAGGFQLTEPGARWRKPGSPSGPVHITSPVNQFSKARLPVPHTCFVVPFSWNLNDLTPEMGATFYLPFSHFAPGEPWPDMDFQHAVPGLGAAGTLVVHHGGLWHGFGPNTAADRARVGFMAGYCAPWLDPVSAGYHLMKKRVRDRMPDEVKMLNRRVTES